MSEHPQNGNVNRLHFSEIVVTNEINRTPFCFVLFWFILFYSIVGMLNTITQESPAPNMTDEGHTMSSDMSGPVSFRLISQTSYRFDDCINYSVYFVHFRSIQCRTFLILIPAQFVICNN